MPVQVIDILMTADLSGEPQMGADSMAGPAGPSPAGWNPHEQHQGQPLHHQVSCPGCALLTLIGTSCTCCQTELPTAVSNSAPIGHTCVHCTCV